MKIYKKGISDNIIPIMVLEGIENKIKENPNKCIYIKNEIGYEIGKSGINKNETLINLKKDYEDTQNKLIDKNLFVHYLGNNYESECPMEDKNNEKEEEKINNEFNK